MQVELDEAERAVAEQKHYVDQLTAALKALDQRVNEVKMRKETLKAQARAAKSRESGAGGVGGDAFKRFDDLATGVDVKEAELALDEELAKENHTDAKSLEVERKLAELGKNQDVEDRLAALKEKLKKPE